MSGPRKFDIRAATLLAGLDKASSAANGTRRTQPEGGVNWLRVSSAPGGSRTTADLVHSASTEDTIEAPRLSAVATDSSRSSTVNVTASVTTTRSP